MDQDIARCTIVALPEKNTLGALNELKNYFGTLGFTYKNKASTSDVHLSLAEVLCDLGDVEVMRTELAKAVADVAPISSKYTEIMNEKRGPIPGKCEYENCWVAVLFEDAGLQDLSAVVDACLVSLGKSTTGEYISRIQDGIYHGNNTTETVIANHMNLCNYCRPEKSEEAREMIIRSIPPEITFDRIALRLPDGSHAWEIDL